MASRIRKIHIYHRKPERFVTAIEKKLPDRKIATWTNREAFLAGIEEVEALLAFRPPRGEWERAVRLRLLQTTGAGVDAVLPAPDLPSGARVANARGIHGEYMAEFALAMILAFEKRIPTWFEEKEKHHWKYHSLGMLRDKRVSILGIGSIGREIARVSRAMNMIVSGTRRKGGALQNVNLVVTPDKTKEIVCDADFVIVLLPLTPETRGFVNDEILEVMPKKAVLINLARGGIVDESALIKRLEKGLLRGAAIDVFSQEPLPPNDPIWDAPNTIVTPHLSGWFPGYEDRLADIFAYNLLALEGGNSLRNEVNRTLGY